jgi:hypothetical protein
MSAIVTLLSRKERRNGTGRGVNSLEKKDVGCAADGVVAETLDDGTERMQQRFAQRARVINQQGLQRRSRDASNSGDPSRVTAIRCAPLFPNRLTSLKVNIHEARS